MEAALYRTATMAAQGVLASVKPGLLIDGKWGRYTQDAFDAAPPAAQSQVDRVLQALGTSVSDLAAYRSQERVVESAVSTSSGTDWIPATEAQAFVRRAAARLGVSEHAPALEQFLEYEAKKQTVSGIRFYNVRSVNGVSRGLFQMQPKAWADAKKVTAAIGNYDANVYNPELNCLAGVAYATINIRQILSRKLPVTLETLYLSHNQGAGILSGMVTAYDKQSAAVRDMIKSFLISVGTKPRFQDTLHSKW